MALFFTTNNPSALLAQIKKNIDDGHIDTWVYDADGDFTHTPNQWKNKSWFRPKIENGKLSFGLIYPKNPALTKVIYGVYHGRFTEMMLSHFDTNFDRVYTTALLSEPDQTF